MPSSTLAAADSKSGKPSRHETGGGLGRARCGTDRRRPEAARAGSADPVSISSSFPEVQTHHQQAVGFVLAKAPALNVA